MNILGIGTDIVEIKRVKKFIINMVIILPEKFLAMMSLKNINFQIKKSLFSQKDSLLKRLLEKLLVLELEMV